MRVHTCMCMHACVCVCVCVYKTKQLTSKSPFHINKLVHRERLASSYSCHGGEVCLPLEGEAERGGESEQS